MTEIPMKIIMDCSTGESKTVPMTLEEIAEQEATSLAYETEELERQAAEQAKEALKQSAIAKLIAAQPLTAEEAALLVK